MPPQARPAAPALGTGRAVHEAMAAPDARSPLQPTRRVEAERGGSVIVAAVENTRAPSRKAESVGGDDEGE
jgi:hypothetical protein